MGSYVSRDGGIKKQPRMGVKSRPKIFSLGRKDKRKGSTSNRALGP